MKPDQTMGRLFNAGPSWALLLLLVLLLSERSTNKTNQLSIEAEFDGEAPWERLNLSLSACQRHIKFPSARRSHVPTGLVSQY